MTASTDSSGTSQDFDLAALPKQIVMTPLAGDAAAAVQLRLVNAQGSSVLEQTVEARPGENDLSMPVADLAPGVYALILQRNGVVVGRARVVKM